MVGTQKLAQQDSGNRRTVGALRFPSPAWRDLFLCSVWPVLVILAVIALAAIVPLPHLEAQAGYRKMVVEERSRL